MYGKKFISILLCVLMAVGSLSDITAEAADLTVENVNYDEINLIDEDFEEVTETTYQYPSVSGWTRTDTGNSIITDADNKFLEFSTASKNTLRSTFTVSGSYVLRYDFKMTEAVTGTASQNLGMIIRNSNNGDQAYITLMQDEANGCYIRFINASLKHQDVYYKGAATVTNDFYYGDFKTGAWHTVKLVKIGKTLYMNIWESGTAEPEGYMFKSTSNYYNYDNIQLACYRGGTDVTPKIYLDNVSLSNISETVETPTDGTPYGGVAPVIAAGKTTTIYAAQKNENISGEGAGGTVRDDGTFYYIHGDNAGEWWTYTVDVEESGEYKLDILGSSGYNMWSEDVAGRFSLEIDGKKIVDGKGESPVIMPANGENDTGSNKRLVLFNDEDKIRIGSFYLTAGEHIIKVTVDAAGEIFGTVFHKFYFTHNTEKAGTAWGGTIPKLAGRGTTTIYAARKNENSDGVGSGGVIYDTFGGDNNVEETPQNMDVRGKSEGEWWTYTINVVKPGTYKIGALGSSGYSADGSDNGGRFSLEIDGEKVVNGTGENAPVLPAWTDLKPWHEFTEADKIQLGSVSLTTGIHTIKFIVDKPGDNTYGVILSRLYFTPDFVAKSGYSVDGIDGWHIEQGTATVEGDPLSDSARDDVICVAAGGEASLIPNIGSINPIGAVELTVDVYAPNGGSVTLEDAKGRIAGEISLANGVINGTNTAYPVNAWKTLTLLAMSGTKTYEVYDGTTLIASGSVSELASARELHVEATSNGSVYIDNIVLREYIKEDSYTEEELETVYVPDFSGIVTPGEIGGTDGWTVNQYNNIEGIIANGDNTASANEYELITDPTGENRGTVIRAQRTSDDSDSIVNRMERSLSADKNLVVSMDIYSEEGNNAELQIQLADQTGAENYMSLLSFSGGNVYVGDSDYSNYVKYDAYDENKWYNVKLELLRENQGVDVYIDNIKINDYPIRVGCLQSELFSGFSAFAFNLDYTAAQGVFYVGNLKISTVMDDAETVKDKWSARSYYVNSICFTQPEEYLNAVELYSVTFRGADMSLSGIPKDNSTVERITVRKSGEISSNGARLIVAVFDESGNMTDMGSCEIYDSDFANNDTAVFEFSNVLANASSVVKAFCIDKLNISPKSEHKEVKIDTPKRRIFLAGDSLVSNFKEHGVEYDAIRGITGWGEVLGKYIDTNEINVINYAIGGTCTKDWFNKVSSRYSTNVFDEARGGDYLLISFGVNDSQMDGRYSDPFGSAETVGSFKYNLMTNFIKPAREKGVIPVLVTAGLRGNYNYGAGRYKESRIIPWIQAVRSLAYEENIVIADIHAPLTDYLDVLGYYVGNKHIFVGDNLHLTQYGAELYADFVVNALKQTDCGINEYIK